MLPAGKSEKLRLYGELLSANLYLAQKGMKSITVPNWYDEGKEVTIPLDLRFTPSQNAQNFFKNYKKKQTAARMLVNLLAEGEKEIAYLETVLYEVESASGEAALNEIRAELKSQGYLKYYKQRDKRQKPADFPASLPPRALRSWWAATTPRTTSSPCTPPGAKTCGSMCRRPPAATLWS